MLPTILKHIIAPPHCICCDTDLPFRTDTYICDTCMQDMKYNLDNTCTVCGKPLSAGYRDNVCHECKKMKHSFIQNISLFQYKDCIRDAIRKMKFGNMEIWIAAELGRQFTPFVKERYGDIPFDGIVCVPLSQINYIKRRFNQAYEIAVPVSRELHVPIIPNALLKIRHTASQSSLGMKDRRENIKGVYKVSNPDRIVDKTLLLIDDVFTTGSTLNECAKTLKQAGAMAVYTATVAITVYE